MSHQQSCVIADTKPDLDTVITTILRQPQCLKHAAPLLASFKVAMSTTSFLHRIDYDKKSRKWMLLRLIPIALYYFSFWRFVQKFIKARLQNKKFQLYPIQYLGFCISVLGHLFRMYCERVMRHEFCFVLVTSGPYRLVRHPRYSGVFLYSVGDCLFYDDLWLWLNLCFKICCYPSRMIGEEQELIKDFGSDYLQYKKCVPYRVIPGVF
mmetsp:Transcript_2922/g.5439  ORF Transcript_2922/g.5439 Transcript_2922/m.5439 type:complete len:209 (+) Transcript_2922:47-673(+)